MRITIQTLLIASSPGLQLVLGLYAAIGAFAAGFVYAVYRTAVTIDSRWSRKAAMLILPVSIVVWLAIFGAAWVLFIEAII